MIVGGVLGVLGYLFMSVWVLRSLVLDEPGDRKALSHWAGLSEPASLLTMTLLSPGNHWTLGCILVLASVQYALLGVLLGYGLQRLRARWLRRFGGS